MPSTGDDKPIYLIAINTPEGEERWLSTETAAKEHAALAFGTREDAEKHARAEAEFEVYDIVQFRRVETLPAEVEP